MLYTPRQMAPAFEASWTPVVICADDYGMTPEVNAGILELARHQRISATSVMSLSPHWSDGASPLRDLTTLIDVGLHLDWTSAFAIEKGFGTSLPKLMGLSTLRLLRPEHIERAIQEQLDLFEEKFQAPPDHVDGHQHIHQFPVIRDVLMHVLSRRYKTQERPWIRIARVAAKPVDLKAQVINAMGAQALQNLAQQLGFAHSQYLTGIYDFRGDAQLYARQLKQWLHELPSNAVLMCHPAQGPCGHAPFPEARLWEQEILLGPAFLALLNETHTRLVRGTDLFGRSNPIVQTPPGNQAG